MSGLLREKTDELALGATVAFAEGVDGIDFSEVVSGAVAEVYNVEALKQPFNFELCEGLSQRGGNVHGHGEGCPADFGKPHLTQLAGPGENILKEISMNTAKMSEVEGTWKT